MKSFGSNSVFILKLIGTLFSVVTVLLLSLTLWMIFNSPQAAQEKELQGLMVSSGILTVATATIAVFIWWIVSNKSRFLNYE